MNITLNTKIRYNGQEYSSIDQLPPEVRLAYERAVGTGHNLVVKNDGAVRLVVNGRQLSSGTEMSPTEKKLYDDAMQLMQERALTTVPPIAESTPAQLSVVAAPETTNNGTTVESGWLTKKQVQLIMIVAGVLLALAVLLALRQ